jgi:sporulation protein YlmC with PRC-barrel domain
MIRLSQLMGQRAVALADAERAGTVQGVVVRGGQVLAVDIGDHVVPSSAIRTFEGDVITFDDHEPVDENLAQRATTVIGKPVLTHAGDGLGNVLDLHLDNSGRVEAVELADRTLPGDQLEVIGSYAAIVADEPPGAGAQLPPPDPSTRSR